MARSRAVTYWSGSGRPVALVKFEPVRPISSASWFIIEAKVSSVPAMPSASAIAASLPDWMMTERRRFRDADLGIELGEHGRAARGGAAVAPGVLGDEELVGQLTGGRRAMSLKTTATVMSLAMLAGSIGRSASFWKSTVPDS